MSRGLPGGSWAVDTSGDHAGTFHVIQSGQCWLHFGETEPEPLEAGDVVLFPRDSRHLLTPTREVPPDVHVNQIPALDDRLPITQMLCGYFEFSGRAVWPLLDSLPDAFVFNLTSATLGDTRSLLNQLIDEAGAMHPGRSAVIDFLVHVLIVHALRQHVQKGARSGIMAALAHPRIGRALQSFHAGPAAGLPDSESALGERLPPHACPTRAWSIRMSMVLLLLWLGPVLGLVLVLGPQSVFTQIATFFSKMAVVTFGGALPCWRTWRRKLCRGMAGCGPRKCSMGWAWRRPRPGR